MTLQQIEKKFNVSIGLFDKDEIEEAIIERFGNLNYTKYPSNYIDKDKLYKCEADETFNGNTLCTTHLYKTRKEALIGLLLENSNNHSVQDMMADMYK